LSREGARSVTVVKLRAAWVFLIGACVLSGLLAGAALGQETTGMEETTLGETTASPDQVGEPDEGCASPTSVETFVGTENQRTPQFEITGDTFRLTYDVEVTDPNGFPVLEVDVLDESGQFIGEGFITFEDDGSEVILAGPGVFSLEIRADDVAYEVVVEDCGGAEPTEPTAPEETTFGIPRKPLPWTGGVSFLPVAALVLGCALVVVAARRRG
jgi:hypothetical protein